MLETRNKYILRSLNDTASAAGKHPAGYFMGTGTAYMEQYY